MNTRQDIKDTLSQMREMKMTNMANKLGEMVEDSNFGLRQPIDVIKELIGFEYTSRKSRKFNRLLARAHLKFPTASLDPSLKDPDRKIDMKTIQSLSECQWIREDKNLLVTGKTGTGKTYIMNALAICALQKEIHVLYTKASLMISELSDAQYKGSYAQILKKYTDVDLLIIDDFGLMSLDIQKCQQLFEVLDAREGNKSVAVISQLPVQKWYDLFQNNVYADACMSRLIGNSYRLKLDGRDMRQNTTSS